MKGLSILAVLLLSLTSLFACNDKITKDTNVLPELSRRFFSEHFAGIPVSHIQIDKDFLLIDSYDVILTDGTNVEFNRKGEWEEVRRHGAAIPSAIIPDFIRKYVLQHYPSATIVAISRDRRDYEVDLDNRLELKFDLKGNLIEID